VDKENRKITLKHGEIKSLDMPAMTMVFQVSDPSVLDSLKAGDKVRFKASNDGGKFTATDIRPSR
jgi:Cu/Ag efflux protein CusF